jgi:serine/threonine protein kinase
MAGEHAPEAAAATDSGSYGLGSFGKYEPFARLGSGGQADVYLAVARGPMRFNKLVVLKCLKAEVADHSELVTMFLDEARLAARLSHPNVVQSFEVGEAAGTYFIAMEYLDGQPLNRLMRVRDVGVAVSPAMWAYIIAEALCGLHYAHELRDYDDTPLRIVHRDVSPHNIFVGYDGVVKIVDFGIAKAALNNARTETGVVKGKVAYMAPEQATGAPLDRRVDIFAIGLVLWEALAGKRLYEGEALAIMHRLVNEPIPRVSSIIPSIDPELDAIVARALEKDPRDRYQTAEEMREALDAYIRSTGKPIKKVEIGRIVSGTFQDLRESIHQQVQTHMANLGTAPSLVRLKTFGLETADGPLPEIGQLGTPSHVEMRLRALGHPSRSEVQAAAAPVTPRRRGLALWAMVAALGLVVAAWLTLRSRANVGAAPAQVIATAAPTPPESHEGAWLSLASDPPGAAVSWNGRALGHTPLRAELAAGPQTIVLSKEGYEDEALVIDLAPSASAAEPLTRAVTLRASPRPSAEDDARARAAAAARAKLPRRPTTAPASAPPKTAASEAATTQEPTPSPSRKAVRPIDGENPFEQK